LKWRKKKSSVRKKSLLLQLKGQLRLRATRSKHWLKDEGILLSFQDYEIAVITVEQGMR
jgi:hypothetical protein